jgi:hypothetical protein
MAYRMTFLASLSVVALVLGANATFADPGAARGAGFGGAGFGSGGPGFAPGRPGFPAFPRSLHHQGRAGSFWPAGGGVFYGLSDEVSEPTPIIPPPKASDDIRYTCVFDIPWDYVHRCPQYSGPQYSGPQY